MILNDLDIMRGILKGGKVFWLPYKAKTFFKYSENSEKILNVDAMY